MGAKTSPAEFKRIALLVFTLKKCKGCEIEESGLAHGTGKKKENEKKGIKNKGNGRERSAGIQVVCTLQKLLNVKNKKPISRWEMMHKSYKTWKWSCIGKVK
ncbi:hypothetical protein K435DRAFT_800197 [Dendrothele bispora CBS 962.96]|uniref:Uncharacterized protein n=1 Tax=Dendrothele bispora (strain CBS 962.96) TaxID=1314807 RepID=A0A4S8LTY2_DENBC|nr:hypothetical protein K435DRAFT_800197 [Dendrothele bispora CBS 962.96]